MRLVSDFYRDDEALRRLVRDLATSPGATALDVGCKHGDISRSLAARQRYLVALDIEAHGEWQERTPNLSFLQASAMALPFPAASFDTAVSSECLQYVPDPGLAMRELARVLRPGGKLVLSFPEGNVLTTWLDPDNLLYFVKRLTGRRPSQGFVRFPRSGWMLAQVPPELELVSHLRRGTLAFIYIAAAIDLAQAVRVRLLARRGAVAAAADAVITPILRALCGAMNFDTGLVPPFLWYNNVLVFRRSTM